MARDLGDATGQTYPRIEWPVIEAPVRPIRPGYDVKLPSGALVVPI